MATRLSTRMDELAGKLKFELPHAPCAWLWAFAITARRGCRSDILGSIFATSFLALVDVEFQGYPLPLSFF